MQTKNSGQLFFKRGLQQINSSGKFRTSVIPYSNSIESAIFQKNAKEMFNYRKMLSIDTKFMLHLLQMLE